MMRVDWWTWKCLHCGWAVKSEQGVHVQQAVAEALIRAHIAKHAEFGLISAPESSPPDVSARLQQLAQEKDKAEASSQSWRGWTVFCWSDVTTREMTDAEQQHAICLAFDEKADEAKHLRAALAETRAALHQLQSENDDLHERIRHFNESE